MPRTIPATDHLASEPAEAYGGAPADAVNLVGPTEARPRPESARTREELILFEPARLAKTSPAILIADRLAEFEHYPKRNRDDAMRGLVQRTRELVASRASVAIFHDRERGLFTDNEWQALTEALDQHGFVSGDVDWIAYTPGSDLDVPEGPPGPSLWTCSSSCSERVPASPASACS